MLFVSLDIVIISHYYYLLLQLLECGRLIRQVIPSSGFRLSKWIQHAIRLHRVASRAYYWASPKGLMVTVNRANQAYILINLQCYLELCVGECRGWEQWPHSDLFLSLSHIHTYTNHALEVMVGWFSYLQTEPGLSGFLPYIYEHESDTDHLIKPSVRK